MPGLLIGLGNGIGIPAAPGRCSSPHPAGDRRRRLRRPDHDPAVRGGARDRRHRRGVLPRSRPPQRGPRLLARHAGDVAVGHGPARRRGRRGRATGLDHAPRGRAKHPLAPPGRHREDEMKMRAMVPDGHGSVVMDDVPEATAGPGEVLVGVRAYSINRGRRSSCAPRCRAGGRGRTSRGRTRRRHRARRSRPVTASSPIRSFSGWAERVAVPANRVALLPTRCRRPTRRRFRWPASLLCGWSATWPPAAANAASSTRARLGGVGHYFVELPPRAAPSSRPCARPRTAVGGPLELGACRVVSEVSQAAGPFDVVIETVGGDVFGRAWRQLDHRGLFVWDGTGEPDATDDRLLRRDGGSNATLRKFLYSDDESDEATDLATLVRLVARDRLHPEIGRTDHWSRTRGPVCWSDENYQLDRRTTHLIQFKCSDAH